MKLVEILAKKVDAWPAGLLGNDGMTQDRTGELNTMDTGKSPDFHEKDGVWHGRSHSFCEEFGRAEIASDYATAIVTRAQWQAERDRQKGGEWKRHRGGDKPKSVSDGEMVEVRLRDGAIMTSQADEFIWNHGDCDESANITKYRVISQPQAVEVDVKDTTIGTLSYKVEIDTTEASQAINDLAAKWDQIDGPLLWRDTVNELDAYIEQFTRERDALINRLALEGFSLLPAMHPVMGVADIDFSDWRNWKEGDMLRVLDNEEDSHGLEHGQIVIFEECDINRRRDAARCSLDTENRNFWIFRENVEFFSRP